MARLPFTALAFVAQLHFVGPALADAPIPPGSPPTPREAPLVPNPAPVQSPAGGAVPPPSSPAPEALPGPALAATPSPTVTPLPGPTPAAELQLTRPSDAIVHVAVRYEGARLEGRSRVDTESWHVLCDAPCDRPIRVEGLDLRVTAPRMTTSNVFLVQPGAGTAAFRVSGGSAQARTLGIIGLAGGLPVAFAGLSLFGLGSIQASAGERTAGMVTLAVGAALTLAALPLLLVGSTSVSNEQGKNIARGAARTPLL